MSYYCELEKETDLQLVGVGVVLASLSALSSGDCFVCGEFRRGGLKIKSQYSLRWYRTAQSACEAAAARALRIALNFAKNRK